MMRIWVFVDLPSHGRSQLIKDMKISDVENWAMNLMSAFDGKGVSIDEVVAHSLDVWWQIKMRCQKIWYISPPMKLRLCRESPRRYFTALVGRINIFI